MVHFLSKEFVFKSFKKFFDKEKSNLKNNTVREIDLNDDRFLELIRYMMNGFVVGEINIKITMTENPNEFFVREIKDISVYKNLMIITW